MSNCIYNKKGYLILKIKDNAYIVYNTFKTFKEGHTHVNSYFVAKAIIYYALNGKFNSKYRHLEKNKYIMKSIERILPINEE